MKGAVEVQHRFLRELCEGNLERVVPLLETLEDV